MTLLYNLYKPINFFPVPELRYMPNGLAFKILMKIFEKFSGLLPNDQIIMVAKFRDSRLRID